MQPAGIDLSAVIAAAGRYLRVEGKELARPNRRAEIACAHALIPYVPTQNLSVSGSDVARRINVDRSAISQATLGVTRNPVLLSAAKTIQRDLETNQH